MRIAKILLAAAALAGAASAQASVTYDVNQPVGVGSVVGTIQTDGVFGTLGAADITAWNLLVTGDGDAVTLTDATSGVYVVGTGLSATPGALTFDYAATGSYLLFQVDHFSGRQYWCNSAGETDCLAGVSAVPDRYTDASAQFSRPEGARVIATAAAVPEPASWAMMIGGFGLIGGAMRRKTRAALRLA